MKNRSLLRGIVASLLTLVITSCGVTKHQGQTVRRTKKPSVKEMLQALEAQTRDFQYARFRASASVESEKQSGSFTIQFKIVQDSAIKADAKKGPLPLGRLLVTPSDYVLVNKLQKCFSRGDSTDMKNVLGVDVDMRWLQDLLLGRPISLNLDEKHFALKDSLYYGLGTHKKKEFQRMEQFQDDPGAEMMGDDVLVKYFLGRDSLVLKGIYAYLPAQEAEIDISFSEHSSEDGHTVPGLTVVNVQTADAEFQLEIKSSKWSFGQPQDMRINVPDSYQVCTPPEPE